MTIDQTASTVNLAQL